MSNKKKCMWPFVWEEEQSFQGAEPHGTHCHQLVNWIPLLNMFISVVSLNKNITCISKPFNLILHLQEMTISLGLGGNKINLPSWCTRAHIYIYIYVYYLYVFISVSKVSQNHVFEIFLAVTFCYVRRLSSIMWATENTFMHVTLINFNDWMTKW